MFRVGFKFVSSGPLLLFREGMIPVHTKSVRLRSTKAGFTQGLCLFSEVANSWEPKRKDFVPAPAGSFTKIEMIYALRATKLLIS